MPPKSKESTEADVVFNRVNVALARNQRLIASWLPPPTKEELAAEQEHNKGIAPDDELFKPVPELLGLGAPLPSDDNGTTSLSKKSNPSLDTLRQQLLGKKRAAEMQKAKASSTLSTKSMTRLGPPGSVLKDSKTARDEVSSGDEDEGRAAAFARRGMTEEVTNRTKKRKRQDALLQSTGAAEDDDPASVENDGVHSAELEQKVSPAAVRPVGTRVRPKSFLDEVLADKAGKRKKKKNKKDSEIP